MQMPSVWYLVYETGANPGLRNASDSLPEPGIIWMRSSLGCGLGGLEVSVGMMHVARLCHVVLSSEAYGPYI